MVPPDFIAVEQGSAYIFKEIKRSAETAGRKLEEK